MVKIGSKKKKNKILLKSIGKEIIKGKFYSNTSHPYWELIYVVKGKGNFFVENKICYSLWGGKAILVKPGIVHSSFPKNNGYLVYCVFFDYPKWKILPSSVKSTEILVEDPIIFETFLSIILKYFVLSFPKEYISNLFSIFLTLLKIEINKQKIIKHKITKIGWVSKKIIDFIEENYYKPLKIKEISSYVHLSPSRIMHIFKEEVGCSINKYIIQYRINMAKHFLVSDLSMPIKEVAHLTGFRNLNYFFLQFKKYVGISPKKYRQIIAG
jgi:AraC family transcriptional regulator of arabinose operon